MTKAEDIIKEEIGALERRLEASPDFRRLTVLRRTLNDLLAITTPQAAVYEADPYVRDKMLSLPAASMRALREAAQPLPTRRLLEEIQKLGKVVGGQNPVNNLSNTLSQDPRFNSVEWGDARAWWLAGEPVPEK